MLATYVLLKENVCMPTHLEQGELFSSGVYLIEDKTPENLFFPQGDAMQQLCDGVVRRPGEAYDLYVNNREAMNLDAPDFYFSTTITTGGFLRDPEISFEDGMKLNHQLARGLADGVIKQFGLDPRKVVLPSDLGKVSNWSQSDFLLYWIHIIYGSQEKTASSLDKHFETNYYQNINSIMSDKNLSTELRRQAYREMIKHIESIILDGENTPGIYNRPLIVPLVDDDFSLGCYGEKTWKEQWRNPSNLWSSSYTSRKEEDKNIFPEVLSNWDFTPRNPVLLKDITDSLTSKTTNLIRRAQNLGASVMGSVFNRESAQAWADYYDDILTDELDLA